MRLREIELPVHQGTSSCRVHSISTEKGQLASFPSCSTRGLEPLHCHSCQAVAGSVRPEPGSSWQQWHTEPCQDLWQQPVLFKSSGTVTEMWNNWKCNWHSSTVWPLVDYMHHDNANREVFKLCLTETQSERHYKELEQGFTFTLCSLPADLRVIQETAAFRRRLKTHHFNMAFNTM